MKKKHLNKMYQYNFKYYIIIIHLDKFCKDNAVFISDKPKIV